MVFSKKTDENRYNVRAPYLSPGFVLLLLLLNSVKYRIVSLDKEGNYGLLCENYRRE